MKKKHIYIPIEIYVREINPKIIFATKAALKNFRVYIGSKTGIDKIINKKIKDNYRAGIYFYKSQIISNRNYIEKIKKSCEKFIVLDEELGVGVSNIKPTLNRRGKNLNDIDKFFVIGKKMMKKLIEYDQNFKKISQISGWLKYDIYKNKNLNIFETEIREIKKNYGNFYLFSSNYGALSEKGLRNRIKNNPTLKKFKNSKNKNNDYYTFKQSINDFKYLKKKLFFFIKKNSETKFVIRPHPADQMYNDWKVFEKFKNVKVINKYDIVPWIIASKGLIHRGCTSAIDAFFLKKPIFFFLPNRKLVKSEKNLIYKISNKIHDFESINFKNLKKKKFDLLINREIYNKNAASNVILNELQKLNITKEENISFNIFENFLNYFIPLCGNIKILLKERLLGSNYIRDTKLPNFINIKTLIKKIKVLNTGKKKLIIKKLTREVFQIEKS